MDACPGQRDAEGAETLWALAMARVDHRAPGAVGARGGPRRAHRRGHCHAAVAATAPDGVLYLIGDSTLKPKRGRKPPVGHCTRHGAQEPDQFGFELGRWRARGARGRLPVAVGLMEPRGRGHQQRLGRQRLKDLGPPAGVPQVVVVAAAGWAATEPLRLITKPK
jgi:hypothetical protein